MNFFGYFILYIIIINMSELVFVGEGQLALSHKHADIAIREQTAMGSADLSNAVIINMRKATMDGKLGSFNTGADNLDEWTGGKAAGFELTVSELVAEIDAQGGAASGIDSVGGLNDDLAAFKTSVMNIFNNGSETLFQEEAFDALSTTFGPAEMLALMKLDNAQAPSSTLAVKNLNKVLRDAVDRGHNGRDSSSEVSDGFKAGDKIYFAAGVALNISVVIADEGTASPANITIPAGALTQNTTQHLVLSVV